MSVQWLAVTRIGLATVGRIALRDRLAQLIQDAKINGDGAFSGDHLLGGRW